MKWTKYFLTLFFLISCANDLKIKHASNDEDDKKTGKTKTSRDLSSTRFAIGR